MRMNVLLDSLDSYQLEEGSVATPYEPYTQVLPKAPQGLRFNGVTDFTQGAYLPSIEFTKSFALEGEFMIDRIPTIGTHALFQNSNASSRIALSVTTQGHLSLSYFDGTIWTGKSGIVPLNQRVKYLATCTNGVLTMSINGVDQTGTSTGYSGIDSSRFTIGQATTNQSNNSFLGIMYSFKATDLIANQTLLNYDFTNPNNIVGNTVLPVGKSITGMNFNGTSDYLQIPALTMDAIEIDCVIDSSQSASAMFLDARNGLSNGHITIDGNGGGWTDLQVDGVPTSITSGIGLVPKNKRVKIKLNAINSFTDDVTIFGKWDTTGNKVKGTIYKVNFYLNGKVIYSLDLENKFYPSQNLIPDFEDSRWVFHPNTQVIGKDVLRLNSTAFGQMSTYKIDLMANQSYYLQVTTNSDRSYLAFYDVNDVEILPRQNIYNTGFKSTFTTASNVSYGILSMYAQVNGSYDFIRPQLYVLDGKQGTINGSPVKQLDSAKRKLYAKR